MVNKWEIIGYIHASLYRQKVLKNLLESEKTPRQLEKDTGLRMAHISRALKELEKLGLVKCLNPKAIRSRFYIITKLGEEILKKVK